MSTWIIAAILAVIAGGVYASLRRMRLSAYDEAVEAVGGGPLVREDRGAAYLGLTSMGLNQSSGQGCLVMTESELYYVQWEPRRRLRIRGSQLKRVETPTAHVRTTDGSPLLCVVFDNELGNEDSATWQVDHLEAWVTALQALSAPGAT